MKKCLFCAEEIQDAAIKCKHCGSMLMDATLTAAQVVAPPPNVTLDQEIKRLLVAGKKVDVEFHLRSDFKTPRRMGTGTYRVDIRISGATIGSTTFGIK